MPISLVQAFRFFSSHSLLLMKQCWIQHHHESQFEIQTDNKLVKEGIVPRWGHRSNLSCDGVPALMREETGCISPCLSHHSPNWTHYWEDKSSAYSLHEWHTVMAVNKAWTPTWELLIFFLKILFFIYSKLVQILRDIIDVGGRKASLGGPAGRRIVLVTQYLM